MVILLRQLGIDLLNLLIIDNLNNREYAQQSQYQDGRDPDDNLIPIFLGLDLMLGLQKLHTVLMIYHTGLQTNTLPGLRFFQGIRLSVIL